MRKDAFVVCCFLAMVGCSYFSPPPKPIGIKGNFKIQMTTGAKYFKETKQYPVAGILAQDVPYLNQAVIPAGTGVLGVYTNSDFSCSIKWTTILVQNGMTLSNASGVAISDCFAHEEIKESDIITARWN